jgi:hypothetical protein
VKGFANEGKKVLTVFHNVTSAVVDVDYGDGMKFDGDAAEAVTIDTNDLLKEAATNSGKIVFWGSLTAEAVFAVAAAKQELKTTRGRRSEIIREGLVNAGEKVTQSMVDNHVESDSVVIEAEAKLARLTADADKCKAVYEAIKQRKEMILMLNRIIQADGGDELREYEAGSPTASSARRRRTPH